MAEENKLIGLLVDDEEGIRSYLSYFFNTMNIDVDLAKDGNEGYELFAKSPEKYDFIISDLLMFETNGVDLLSKIKENHSEQFPPSFIITGSAIDEVDGKGLVNEFFTKPFKLDHIKSTLEKIQKKNP